MTTHNPQEPAQRLEAKPPLSRERLDRLKVWADGLETPSSVHPALTPIRADKAALIRYALSHLAEAEAERDRLREALENAYRDFNTIAARSQVRKISATAQYAAQHIFSLLTPARSALTTPEGKQGLTASGAGSSPTEDRSTGREGVLEREALLRIVEVDRHYRTPPKPKPDGGIRGWAGQYAAFVLTGQNGSCVTDAQVRAAVEAKHGTSEPMPRNGGQTPLPNIQSEEG